MGETASGGHRYSEIQCFQLIYRNIAETQCQKQEGLWWCSSSAGQPGTEEIPNYVKDLL